jgi:hypothetical protein
MTHVGKILVFLNLIFSLVVGGFVIAIYVARAHWVDEFKKLQDQNTVLTASAKTFQSEAQKAKVDADALLAKKNDELKSVQQDRDVALSTIAQMRDELGKVQTARRQESAFSTTYSQEVAKRQEDVSQLRESLRKERENNNALVKKNAELTDREMSAQIERRAVQEQNGRLEKQLQQVYKDMARIRSNGGSTTTARSGGKNPPPEDVEGLVKNTDPSGLMTITIGSDAGLAKGHTLELFRVNTASPTQSRYLGTVRILEAEAHQAVVQPVGRLSATPQPGDRVASRILAGRS